MKKTFLTLMVAAFVGSGLVMADEAETSSSTDTSRNPITGTTTTKSKYKKTEKGADGSEQDTTVTNKKSVQKDGTVKQEIEKESKTVPADAE